MTSERTAWPIIEYYKRRKRVDEGDRKRRWKSPRDNRRCYHCKKPGHKIAQCHQRIRDSFFRTRELLASLQRRLTESPKQMGMLHSQSDANARSLQIKQGGRAESACLPPQGYPSSCSRQSYTYSSTPAWVERKEENDGLPCFIKGDRFEQLTSIKDNHPRHTMLNRRPLGTCYSSKGGRCSDPRELSTTFSLKETPQTVAGRLSQAWRRWSKTEITILMSRRLLHKRHVKERWKPRFLWLYFGFSSREQMKATCRVRNASRCQRSRVNAYIAAHHAIFKGTNTSLSK